MNQPSVIDYLFPRMRQVMMHEARGMDLSIQREFDKITISSGTKSIGIPHSSLMSSFERDDYDAIEHAALAAIRYLKSFDMTRQYARRRAFRTKQRNIIARR